MKNLSKRQLIEFFVGIGFFVLILILGLTLFPDAKRLSLIFRMFIGLVIGYALSRAAMGFAGTVNRAYRTGSTKLMKAIALLFILGGVVTFIAVISGQWEAASLTHKGINWGLLIGATLFGFGMALTICCASGVLTDLAESPLRALIVLFFFCAGGFLGIALKKQSWMAWINEGVFGIEAFKKGINFTTWFKWDGTNGALGALILTILLAVGVMYLSNLYENRRKNLGTFIGCDSECACEKALAENPENETLFYRLFVKPWSLTTGACVLAVAFAMLMFGAHSTWGVSGPLGQWFARMLHMFGVSTESLIKFTKGGLSIGAIEGPFFQNAMYVQDLSIFAGALIATLMAGRFTANVKGWLFNPLEIIFYAFGGICLGIAINLAAGCNAGGLFSPIATFSLSGWIYLICIVGGGILGNMVVKHLYKAFKITK